jgi:hypothetical protein
MDIRLALADRVYLAAMLTMPTATEMQPMVARSILKPIMPTAVLATGTVLIGKNAAKAHASLQNVFPLQPPSHPTHPFAKEVHCTCKAAPTICSAIPGQAPEAGLRQIKIRQDLLQWLASIL